MVVNTEVIVRIRPPNKNEEISPLVLRAKNSQVCEVQTSSSTPVTFQFDRVFGPSRAQQELFESLTPIVDGVLNGISGTVLAYGQTGSGKSYSMMGDGDGENRGMIPRIVEHLVGHAKELCISYVEIYNERVRDLLISAGDLGIQTVGMGFDAAKGLARIPARTQKDIMKLLNRGNMNRAVNATSMNQQSSRSHAVIVLDTGNARLFLVDLAGSESAAKSHARGSVLKEAGQINQSLTALGMVISALAKGVPYVPYRNSKLTRLLQEALGGNSRTVVIVCCSPSGLHIGETLTSLRFGTRAMKVEVHPEGNEPSWHEKILSELETWRRGGRPLQPWVEIESLLSDTSAAQQMKDLSDREFSHIAEMADLIEQQSCLDQKIQHIQSKCAQFREGSPSSQRNWGEKQTNSLLEKLCTNNRLLRRENQQLEQQIRIQRYITSQHEKTVDGLRETLEEYKVGKENTRGHTETPQLETSERNMATEAFQENDILNSAESCVE